MTTYPDQPDAPGEHLRPPSGLDSQRPGPFEVTGPTRTEHQPAVAPLHVAARTGRWPAVAKRVALGLAMAAALVLLVWLALIVVYRFVDPPASTLMLAERLQGGRVVQDWQPLARISPNLMRAVVMSEDARFCSHHGVDWDEIGNVIEQAGDGPLRGGSTISMQVAKNLFLWSSKSYVRKAIEIPLTLVMEVAWPKARILEIYLNVAEWGPGTFGAEAAARRYFRKPASRLTEYEAALLAVVLPNPIARNAGAPGPGTRRLAQRLLLRMRGSGPYVGCLPLRRSLY